jgi:hypothetical protein
VANVTGPGALVLRSATNQYDGLYQSFVATTNYAVYGLQADTLSSANVRGIGEEFCGVATDVGR